MKSYKVRYMLCMFMGGALLVTGSGCGNSPTKEIVSETIAENIQEAEPETEMESYTKEDIGKILNLEKKRYILIDTMDIDLTRFADYDEDVIIRLSYDDSEVDFSKEGTYPVTYTFEIDAEAMNCFLSGSEKSEGESPDDDSEKMDLVQVSYESDVTIVTADKAAELAKEKIAVLTDKNKVYTVRVDESEMDTQESKATEKETEPVKTVDANKDKADSGSGQGSTTAQQSQPSMTAPQDLTPQQPQTQAQTQAPQPETQHVHNWVEQFQVVHHDAVTQQVWIEDSAAWDEVIYEWRTICNGCGADITGNVEHTLWCGTGSYHNEQIQTGTVHHEATGHYETQVVQAAYDETVVTGYKCSGCGETKAY